MELHRRRLLVPPNGEDECPLARIPVGALEDAGLALEPQAVGRCDVLVARREHVEHESASGLEHRGCSAERPASVVVVDHVEHRPERDRHERNALGDRRPAQIADPEVETFCDALALRVRVRHREHSRRLVDADHPDPGLRRGYRDPSRPDGQLDDGAARSERLLDVELHVLLDRHRPRVVDPRDPVVQRAVAHAGRRAT